MQKTKKDKWSALNSDCDTINEIRQFSGRMTKLRWKIISRYVRKMYWRESCNHEWDCCGCVFMEYGNFSYSKNQVTIIKTTCMNC